jgi:hypothetical protein
MQMEETTMAWENITYKCGHAGREQFYGKCSTRTVRAERRGRENLCPECEEKRLAEHNAASAAKNAEAGLPALKGSDKQKAWAESIRVVAVESYEKLIKDVLDNNPPKTEWTEEAIQAFGQVENEWRAILAETSASYWIDSRGESAREMIRQRRAS